MVLQQSRSFYRLALVLSVIGFLAFKVKMISAEEPAREFLARLRTVGYFDTAIDYLDRVDKLPGVDADLVDAVPLEKAQTYIDAAVASRSAKDRDAFFVSATDQLQKFLERGSHPRQAEARLQLGKLQMLRGGQLMAAPQPSDEVRGEARQSYLEAAKTFDAIVANLRETLESMKGERIDAKKEPTKVAQRDQYRFEFLQAQLRGAEARQLAAKTFIDPAKDGKALLEESLKAYTDLSDKHSGFVQGALAMTFRGQVQTELGLTKEAIDSFQRALEQPEVDPLRASRLQAVTGLVNLWMTTKPTRLKEAVALGQRAVDAARPNEKRAQELIDLQLALAQAYLAAADELKTTSKKPGEEKSARTNGRQMLLAISRLPGTHDQAAKDMLAKLGIERDETSATPKSNAVIKSLDDALNAARELLIANEELTKMSQAGDDKADSDESAAIDEQLDQNRGETIDVLRRGLAIGSKDIDLLNQARQYLAYALYQREMFHDAAAAGEFLSRTAPRDPKGLSGGLVALSSLQNLIQSTADDESTGLVRQIESLGGYLSSTWPDDPQAAAAKGIMIQLALKRDRWDDAKALLAGMTEGDEKAAFKRLMGQLIWNRSLLLRQENQMDQADALLPAAASELREGLEKMPGNLVGVEPLQAALVLAKVELRQGDPAAALAVLDHPKYGPIKQVKKQGDPVDGFASDLYSAELQAVVGVMTTDGSDTPALLKRAQQVMGQLQTSVKGKEDASARLVKIYLGMARDIREQLDSATPDRKAKLIGAFRVFLESIAKSSNDPATLQWVGQTLMQMGESSMEPGQRSAQGQAKDLLATSITTLSDLIAKQGDDAAPALKYQLARAYRLSGEYKQAIDLLEGVLKLNAMMLDAQVEAATAYEQWAATIDPKYASKAYDAALLGARPGEGGNVIWGWGRVSKLVSGREEFRDTFFDARYHVALCRFLSGKATKNNSVMEAAMKDITQVAALYPELGGPTKHAEFNSLMKQIQKTLGKKADGLPPREPKAG